MSSVKFLPDYACTVCNSKLGLKKVGIDGISVYRTDFNNQKVLTTQSAYVSLGNQHGIHMSRLVEIVSSYMTRNIEPIDELLEMLSQSHGNVDAYWECWWDSLYDIDSVQYVKVTCKLEGIIVDDKPRWFITLHIPYTSICPCSAEMVKYAGEGIPHMQRATAKVTCEISGGTDLNTIVPYVISKVLNAVKVYPLPLMKRTDELAWCQNASVYNYFVEDAARLVGNAIANDFIDWIVICEHQESIHQHNVVAICSKGGDLL